MRKSFAGAAAAALIAASALRPIAGPPASADYEACNWPMFGNDLGRSFAATEECSAVSATNVSPLRKKWFADIGAVAAQPIVDHGVVYVGTYAGDFYAIDAGTGLDPETNEPLWK